mgnify:CR=1 FL=1
MLCDDLSDVAISAVDVSVVSVSAVDVSAVDVSAVDVSVVSVSAVDVSAVDVSAVDVSVVDVSAVLGVAIEVLRMLTVLDDGHVLCGRLARGRGVASSSPSKTVTTEEKPQRQLRVSIQEPVTVSASTTPAEDSQVQPGYGGPPPSDVSPGSNASLVATVR